MALESEVYFANLVAENLDLKSMKSIQILERVLNLEKAFVSEKSCTIQQVRSSNNPLRKSVSCKHCGYPHDRVDCCFKDLACNICHKKGHLKQVCRSASSEEKGNSEAKQYSKKSSTVGNNSCKKTKKKQKKVIKTVEDVNSSNDSDDEKLLSVKTVNSVRDEI